MQPELLAARERESSPVNPRAPVSAELMHLKARDGLGWICLSTCAGVTALALGLSVSPWPLCWFVGQLLLALALLQWFVLLHEAGHNTLFRTHRLNRYAGHLAGFFALIPFPCWKLVHGLHHHWTGWQDLDATTAALVPRPLGWCERLLVNVCWRCWLPLFSILYRANNFWNLPRLVRLFPSRSQHGQVTRGVLVAVAVYCVTGFLVGWLQLLQAAGVGLFLSLALQDPLILSQHTHVPLRLSNGAAVPPFPPLEQEAFTRSLKFPRWFSTLVLLNLDAHELHHMYPAVPGYYLRRIAYEPHHEVPWWRWLRQAKRLPGAVFLFQNSNQSGYDL